MIRRLCFRRCFRNKRNVITSRDDADIPTVELLLNSIGNAVKLRTFTFDESRDEFIIGIEKRLFRMFLDLLEERNHVSSKFGGIPPQGLAGDDLGILVLIFSILNMRGTCCAQKKTQC